MRRRGTQQTKISNYWFWAKGLKEKGGRGRREEEHPADEDFQLINSELNTLASSCVRILFMGPSTSCYDE